jgi:uncharacterized Zn ribbon protein
MKIACKQGDTLTSHSSTSRYIKMFDLQMDVDEEEKCAEDLEETAVSSEHGAFLHDHPSVLLEKKLRVKEKGFTLKKWQRNAVDLSCSYIEKFLRKRESKAKETVFPSSGLGGGVLIEAGATVPGIEYLAR